MLLFYIHSVIYVYGFYLFWSHYVEIFKQTEFNIDQEQVPSNIHTDILNRTYFKFISRYFLLLYLFIHIQARFCWHNKILSFSFNNIQAIETNKYKQTRHLIKLKIQFHAFFFCKFNFKVKRLIHQAWRSHSSISTVNFIEAANNHVFFVL